MRHTYFNPKSGPEDALKSQKKTSSVATGWPVTVLETLSPDFLNCKQYKLADDGSITTTPYSNAKHFKAKQFHINGIHELHHMLGAISKLPRRMIIRGLHRCPTVEYTPRLKELFPEHRDGTPWVMIDFDDIPLPDGMDPLSQQALEYGISLLPAEFSQASYVYQHSSSAGLVGQDDCLRKAGLNAHAFFWLSRCVPGDVITTWLKSDALERGNYQVRDNKGGIPMVRWAFDPAVLKNPVQPHYTASPLLGEGVQCLLNPEDRLGLVEKTLNAVPVPSLSHLDAREVKDHERALCEERKRELGWIKTLSRAVSNKGSTIQRWAMRPPASIQHTGRAFVDAHFTSSTNDRVILEFEDENTPGSWWVGDKSPMVARRFGDEAEIDLWELSPDAHDHVAHRLGWFNPMASFRMALDEQGFLPQISRFVKSRTALVLAPTGSGKTYQIGQWIKEQSELVIYTADTIALNRQTFEDLQEEGIRVGFYTDVRSPLDLGSYDCVVTTHKSLPRIQGLLSEPNRPYKLVIDEAHRAVEWMLQNCRNLNALEHGLKSARQTLLLTGTLSDVQSKCLSDVLFESLGSLEPHIYSVFEFQSIKRNPLELRNEKDFDVFLYRELERVREALAEGKEPPRVVALVPTSRMERFHAILRGLDLCDHADVVSRPESLEERVYEARTSIKPILIASPLFALGINFTHLPDTLLIGVGLLQWDENAFIQAVNRGNRSDKACRTILFIGKVDPTPIKVPPKLMQQAAIELDLSREATIEGALESHLHLDRVTMREMLMLEKNSAKALGALIGRDGFQNYRIHDLRSQEIKVPEEVTEGLKRCRAEGRAAYDSLIADHRSRAMVGPESPCKSRSNVSFLARLDQAKAVREDWKNDSEDRPLPREVEATELAAIADLCNLDIRSHMEKVSKIRLRRLMGDRLPYLTPQHHMQETHYTVASEKLICILDFISALDTVRDGQDTYWFANQIRSSKRIREGIRALADNESDFHRIMAEHKELQRFQRAYQRSSSSFNRERLNTYCLEHAKAVFGSIGITWAKHESGEEKGNFDHRRPLFPAHLDLNQCRFNVMQLAEACKRWENHREPMYFGGAEDVPWHARDEVIARGIDRRASQRWRCIEMIELLDLGIRDPDVCKDCVFFKGMACLKGHEVDWLRDTPVPGRHFSCSQHRKAPRRLLDNAEWKVDKFLEKLPSPKGRIPNNHAAFSEDGKTNS